ncbi:MAG: hypothetical protein AB8D78_06185 [Akkermansiaceae bacterium]
MKRLLILAAMTTALIPLLHAEKPKPLVLYRIGDVPVEMREGDTYGVMLVNEGGKKHPSPRYILAMAKTRTLVDTKDIEVFRAMVKRLPKGATVFEYDSCTVPRSWGLKDEQYIAYNKALKDAGLEISEETRRTCYCR